MLFNSIDFALFLPIVFTLYWFVFSKNLRSQNVFILAASYFFYGWWDWRFLSLIAFSTLLDFTLGSCIAKANSNRLRKMYLVLSIAGNIGLLAVFKYYNFFLESLNDHFSMFNQSMDSLRLDIILPVGISFYTFQTLSYTIDIYRGKFKPTRDLISFAAFVAFFPQLVAGPIERAQRFLPQFLSNRVFKYQFALAGMRQILWGLFMKIVIADSCAVFADRIFQYSEYYSGSTLFLGALLFGFQIYGDFAGYSNIAIGVAKLFGFSLSQNFNHPFFAKNIRDFWHKWHISLSTWFRDYLYIPLGGSKYGIPRTILNVILVFLIAGLWHGANWTYVLWGLLHGILLSLYILLPKSSSTSVLKRISGILLTFILVTLTWVFFRSETISQAFEIFSGIFSSSLFNFPEVLPKTLFIILIGFSILEWMGRKHQYSFEIIEGLKNRIFRRSIYYVLIAFIIYHSDSTQEFIYFQF